MFRLNDAQNEALKIWSLLKPMIDQEIADKTANVVRRKKMTVVTAPNGSTIGVKEIGNTSALNVPYVSSLSSVAVGSTVWCEWVYSMSNLVAVSTGSGT